MKVIIVENYEEMSAKAAELLTNIVKNNPKAVLGLATGSSPIGTYQNMAKDHRENGTSYKDIVSVNLDEYVGLTADHDQSYAYFMYENLFKNIDVDLKNTGKGLTGGMRPLQQAFGNLSAGRSGAWAWLQRPHRFQRTRYAVRLGNPLG